MVVVSRRSEEELRAAYAVAREQASARDAAVGKKVRHPGCSALGVADECTCHTLTSVGCFRTLQGLLGSPSLRLVRCMLAGWRLRVVVAVDLSGANAAAAAIDYGLVVKAFHEQLAPFVAPHHAYVVEVVRRLRGYLHRHLIRVCVPTATCRPATLLGYGADFAGGVLPDGSRAPYVFPLSLSNDVPRPDTIDDVTPWCSRVVNHSAPRYAADARRTALQPPPPSSSQCASTRCRLCLCSGASHVVPVLNALFEALARDPVPNVYTVLVLVSTRVPEDISAVRRRLVDGQALPFGMYYVGVGSGDLHAAQRIFDEFDSSARGHLLTASP